MINYLTISPTRLRYRWEAEVLFNNLKTLGYPMENMIWITYVDGNHPEDNEVTLAAELASKYGIQHYHYEDDRPLKQYPTSSRLWLWKKFLEEEISRQGGTYFYIDTDVLFSRLPDLESIPYSPHSWFGSETGKYTGLRAVLAYGGQETLDVILDATDNSFPQATIHLDSSPGAQWIIDHPKPEVFEKAYYSSERIYTGLEELNKKRGFEPVITTPWLSDMWALAWTLKHFGIHALVHDELEFNISSTHILFFTKHAIFHNSGVAVEKQENHKLFQKNRYQTKSPFGRMIVVNDHLCSFKYAQAIAAVDPSTQIVPLTRAIFVDENGNPVES